MSILSSPKNTPFTLPDGSKTIQDTHKQILL